MSISFRCESCKKKVKAPDGAGGKYASCPFCNHRCYIPLPKSQDEQDLVLAPLDESAETEYQQKMAEVRNLTRQLLNESDVPDEPESAEMDERELTKNVIIYLRQMADGKLDDAQDTAGKIVRFRTQAAGILDKMARSERPEPELADVAPPILAGFIKNLRARLG